LEEELDFELEGLEIEGHPGQNCITVEVPPKQEVVVKLKPTGGAMSYGCSASYEIK